MNNSTVVKKNVPYSPGNFKKIIDMKVKYFKRGKAVFLNLSISKRLTYGFAYVGVIAVLFFAIGLTGMLSLDNKIKRFSEDSYKMETAALNAEVALMSMQNHVYKAMQTDKEDVSLGLVKKAEAEYVDMLSRLKLIYESDASVKSVTPEMKEELQKELKKAERYHKKFNECIVQNDVKGAFGIYKNDFAPILGSISTVLASIHTTAGDYARMYVMKSRTQTLISIIVFLVLVGVGLVTSFIIAKLTSKSIVEPIKEIEEAVYEISKGNLDINLDYRSKEELGALSHAVRKTTVFLKAYIENITDVLKRLEKKDMKVAVDTEYVGSFAPIKGSLVEIIKFYNEMTGVLKNTSAQVSTGAQQLAGLSQAITDDANAQTDSIYTLVEQVNTISKEIERNAENVSKAQELSMDSMKTAQTGNLHMHKLVGAVEEINQHSKEIANINQLIKNIAEQTHLLSLNASIEAARAGVHGYGFAVVAGEIRKLSDQTKDAVQTVNDLVNISIGSIEQGNVLAKETAVKLKKVEEYSEKTNGLIENISHASKGQTEKLKEALKFLKQVSNIANENLAVAEESYATSTEFLNQADILQEKLAEFVV